jgi:ATP-binding cassette subfamily A (ABC1) protein 3
MDKVSGNLSGGNKRKLSVGISLIGNPPIILLDEPSNGMDPEARRFMWAVIHKISKTRKKSSVILTTHSMEEAETLCRRMGIMVSGQFKCLGTSQQIKDRYGVGYEIDIGIQHITDEMLSQFNMNLDENITKENIGTYLDKLNKSAFIKLIQSDKLGREVYEEINNNRPFSLRKLIDWTFYTENILMCISKLLDVFNEVDVYEFWENNFRLKIKKNDDKPVTIGYLFGLIEDQKKVNYVTEYSISQTSMEQIFNNFARGGKDLDKHEIVISREQLDVIGIKSQ